MQEKTAAAANPKNPTRRERRAFRRDKDPQTAAHIDGSAEWTKLRNPNPGLKYVWAYEGNTDTGAAYYHSLGYDPVECKGDGTDPDPGGRRIAQKGEPYRSHGHILMAISREEWEDIRDRGEDGNTGQRLGDEMERRVRNSRADAVEMQRLRAAGLHAKPYYGEQDDG